MVSRTVKIAGLATLLLIGAFCCPELKGPTERTRAGFGMRRTITEINGAAETNYFWMVGRRKATDEEMKKYNLPTDKVKMWEFYSSMKHSYDHNN